MRTIGIFISSTFKDMDAERDMVINVLKPALESALKYKHVDATVRIVDLRWGVNTQDVPEEERENKVLSDCLDYIRTSRPFFIGFIGDRYGWIPPEDRWKGVVDSMTEEEKAMMGSDLSDVRSVTELEMLFGVLNDRNALPSSFFFLRKPDVYQQMDTASRSVFCDSDPLCVAKLERLREKVRDTYRSSGYTGNVIDYDCSWNGTSLTIDEKAISSIVDPLVRTIMSQIDIDKSECTGLDDIIRSDMALAEERESYYVPDDSLVNAVSNHLKSSRLPLVIKAEDGMGKTSMIAHLFNLFRNDEHWMPLVHFTSKAGYDSFGEVMLKKFLWQLPGQGFPKYPLAVETHPGLLMKYLSAVAGQQGRRVLLLIDNVQYMRDLKLILSDLADEENLDVVLTSNVDISYLRDGVNARYIGIPDQSVESTGRIASLFMDLSHKGLPSKVLSSLLAKKTDEGKPACRCPLWTIIVLNYLIGLDLNDFARMRNITDVDDAEKISVYLQGIINDVPSSAQLLPEYLIGAFETQEESYAARLFMTCSQSGFTSLDLMRKKNEADVSFFTFHKVKKALSPLLVEDYISGVLKFDNDVLCRPDPQPLDVSPIDQTFLWNHLYHKAIRLAQVSSHLPEDADDAIHEVIRSEFGTTVALFNEQTVDGIINSASSDTWTELEHLFAENPERTFRTVLERYHQTPDYDNQLLLCISYWHLSYRCKSLYENSYDPQLLSHVFRVLDSAFMEMNGIIHKSLSSLLADEAYFGLKSDFEKRYRANMADAIHYKCLQEQTSRILYLNSPTFSLTYRYASCLDENSANWLDMGSNVAQQKRYIETGLSKNALSVELFGMLSGNGSNEGLLLDLYMAKVRRSALLICLDNSAALKWNGNVIDEMHSYITLPGFARQYSFACDYQARCLLASGRFEEAAGYMSKAIAILETEHERHPDDVELHHSLATAMKYRADIFAADNALTRKCVNDLEAVVLDILDGNHEDSFAQRQLLMALVLDLYSHAFDKDTDGLYDLTVQTLRMSAGIMTSGDNVRYLEMKYFIPAMNFVFRNLPKEQSQEVASMYSALRNELLNRRLITPDYLPALTC